MPTPVITATGLFTPDASISNEELVEAFNAWSERWNAENADAIAAGDAEAKPQSSVGFIEKASGIKSRYVMDREGILDPARMRPDLPERANCEISVMAEMGVAAGREALDAAGISPGDIDAVICAASNMQRAYPAMAVEIQDALGIGGFAFDMNVACSSATFGLQVAADMVRSGSAKRVLMVNPEICSGHLNFTDRDSHFIFGDVATAALVEDEAGAKGPHWQIVDTRLQTQFSNNIRNNFGFLNRADPDRRDDADKLFVQEGRKVFKDVVPWVSQMIRDHMDALGLSESDLRRLWLHQANANMNRLIAQRVLGREATDEESPTVLDTYANTSSAGSMIAFHKHNDGFEPGETGLICSFGAGYSAGTVFVRRAP